MPIFLDTSSATRKDGITSVVGDGVDTTSLAYERMKARWDLTNDLRGGADAMRDSGVKWLAMEMAERLPEYRRRLGRTHLLGAYDDAVEKLVAKPFSRNVTLAEEENLSEKLALTADNPDLEGGSITTFFRKVFDIAVDRGLAHVLVDFAAVGEGLNAQQERDLGVHPYFVHVNPDQLIGWRWRRKASTGVMELAQIRIKTTVVEILDDFGEQEVEYIRIINAPADVSTATDEELEVNEEELLGTWEVWRLDPKDTKWKIDVQSQTHTYPGIPLVTLYIDKAGDLEGRPALWRLAELNLEHWQKKSDQDNLLHVARVPILFRKGFTADELKKPVVVGGARSVGSTQKDADMSYVEHSGKALGAGQTDLDKIEEQMERSGLEPLARRASSTLATNMMISDVKETNLLQAWSGEAEVHIEKCFDAAGRWVNEKTPTDFSADIFNEFGLSARATDNLKQLDTARARGDISHETYLNELKRYAAMSSEVDTQEELARIEEEGPALAMIGLEETETEEEEEQQTGETNGHTHAILDGVTGETDGHTHQILDGVTGPASNGDPHTHTVSQEEQSDAA